MIFNIHCYFFSVIILSNLFNINVLIVFSSWLIIRFFIVVKLYRHISFILLAMELMSLITIIVVAVLLRKSSLSVAFFFFYICFVVGEAILGLRLLVIRSRLRSKELSSLTL